VAVAVTVRGTVDIQVVAVVLVVTEIRMVVRIRVEIVLQNLYYQLQ
jgi:hypothetical protein